MVRKTFVAAALLLVGLWVPEARAHFLFIRIGEPAEAGRAVEVYFSERAEAGDPRFISKTAPTRLWLQSAPGKFEPLPVRQGADRLRASLFGPGTVSVSGFLEYGVLKREVSFLLRYYPKAVAGDPNELNAFQLRPGAALEIKARFDGDKVAFTLLRDGKPVPEAQFTTVDDDLSNEEVKADRSGQAVWKPPSPGFYCVYAKSVLKTPGSLKGKAYSEIREFATLAFPWPLVRTDADAEAVALFERALAARAVWNGFPGFTAEVSGSVDGREFKGQTTVAADGDVSLKLDEGVVKKWVSEQVESLVMHRLPQSRSEGKPVLRFGDREGANPLGRLLVFQGGQFASSYRVRDNHITVVNRRMGGQNMAITILEDAANAEGKLLPRSYIVQYWNAMDGALERTESYSVRFVRVGRFDLPASVTLTTASQAGLSVRTLAFDKHQLAQTGQPQTAVGTK